MSGVALHEERPKEKHCHVPGATTDQVRVEREESVKILLPAFCFVLSFCYSVGLGIKEYDRSTIKIFFKLTYVIS